MQIIRSVQIRALSWLQFCLPARYLISSLCVLGLMNLFAFFFLCCRWLVFDALVASLVLRFSTLLGLDFYRFWIWMKSELCLCAIMKWV